MHFTTTRNTDTESMQNWYRMRLKPDLLAVLKENGCLPVNTPDKALGLYKDLNKEKERALEL